MKGESSESTTFVGEAFGWVGKMLLNPEVHYFIKELVQALACSIIRHLNQLPYSCMCMFCMSIHVFPCLHALGAEFENMLGPLHQKEQKHRGSPCVLRPDRRVIVDRLLLCDQKAAATSD